MGVKNTAFFLDLNTLDKKGDQKLKEFAKREDLEEKDIIKIIYNEASRIGEKDKVKVTFKVIDDDDDTFRIVVEHANIKYKGTVIYPFKGVKSNDFSIDLDSVFGKITLYNKKEECDKITVTIDGIALDIFSMTYKKAKEFLMDISDRKEKGGYIDFPDSICFKNYGIKLNSKKSENGDIKVDDNVASIDIYNREEFFKEYYFEEKEEQKYDVNIPLPDKYNYEKNKNLNNDKIEEVKDENKEVEIEIELPQEVKPKIDIENKVEDKIDEIKQEEKVDETEKRQEELERIKAKQDAELEKVKEKLKRELEEQLNTSIKRYDEQNEKRVKEESKETVEESKEDIINTIDEKDENEVNEIIEKIEQKDVVEVPKEEKREPITLNKKINSSYEEENTNIIDKKDEINKVIEEKSEPVIVKEKNYLYKEENEHEKEIKELERLLEEEKKQQEILETRIKAKLDELKSIVTKKEEEKAYQKVQVKEINETIEVTVPTGFLSYEIESYKGIKEQGKEKLDIYFGQSKQDIRKYFGGMPKEIRDYDEMEMYDIFYAYYDENDKCTGIGIYNQEVYKDKIALYMFGRNLITMSYREIVKLIKKNDYNAIEDDDGIISLKYGISVDPRETSNYKDEISEVIHIFKKGYYDEVYENF